MGSQAKHFNVEGFYCQWSIKESAWRNALVCNMSESAPWFLTLSRNEWVPHYITLLLSVSQKFPLFRGRKSCL